MNKIPIGLIIDDGGIANMFHFHQMSIEHPMKVTPYFVRRFANICRENGVRGKFSVVPMPGALGRIDGDVAFFKKEEIKCILEIIKNEIQPQFSITPEILTHFRAYDIEKKSFMHIFEDVYFSNLDAETIAKYIGLALEILCNVNLNPTGVTSPWMLGIDNEQNYAKGIGLAFKQGLGRDLCFYFLHSRDEVTQPVIMENSPDTGTVVSIPATTADAFWCSQKPATRSQAIDDIKNNIDALLSPDGKTGIIRSRIAEGKPITLITHWQSIFSDGEMYGLDGLEVLVARIKKYCSEDLQWVDFLELAKITAGI